MTKHLYTETVDTQPPLPTIEVQTVWLAIGGNPAVQANADQLMKAITTLRTADRGVVEYKLQAIEGLVQDIRTHLGEAHIGQYPTDQQIADACVAYQHDWGLLSPAERTKRWETAKAWYRVWRGVMKWD